MPTLPKIAAGPSRHVYDVIVLGGQLGGAMAATLLAKRGYRVLLIEHDGMGHGYEHDGYLLPYAPFVAPPLRTMPRVEDAFTELGLTTTVQRTVKPHSPPLQLVFPRHRVDLPQEESKRTAELTREFGAVGADLSSRLRAVVAQHEESDGFFRELHALPPDGMMEAWTLKGQIRKHPGLERPSALEGSDEPTALLQSLAPFLTYLNDPQEPLARARAISQALKSPCRYPGGREGFRELLCKKLVDLGGDLLSRENSEGAVAENLEFEGGKLVGVKLIQSETIYRASFIVAATDAGALRRLIEDKKKHRKLAELLDSITTERFVFTVNWVLPEQCFPRGMGELLLMETGEKDLGPLLIQVHPTRRVERADEDELRTVCAGAFIPAKARDLGEGHLHQLRDRISEKLERLMPFARSKVVSVSAPYLDAGGVRGARLLPHPAYSVSQAQTLGITGLAQRTPTKNFVIASREVLPGLGLEGEFLAGMRAAELVQETLKKNDPLKR